MVVKDLVIRCWNCKRPVGQISGDLKEGTMFICKKCQERTHEPKDVSTFDIPPGFDILFGR